MECKTHGCSRPVYIKKRQLCRPCYAKWHKRDWTPSNETCSVNGCERLVYVKKRALCRTCYAHFDRVGVPPQTPPLDKTQHISLPKAAQILGCTERKLNKLKERGELKLGKLTMRDVDELRARWSIVLHSESQAVRIAFDWTAADCLHCGTRFHRKPSRAKGFYFQDKWIKPTRYCSPQCKAQVRASLTRQPIARHWVAWPDGTVVSRAKAETAWAIGRRSCTNCSTNFWPSSAAHHYCSARCKKQHRQAAKRARISGAKVVEIIGTRDVLNAHGWRCHLCGEEIDRRLSSPHPMAGSIDHLTPLSLGGTHTWDNLAAAHMRCNSIKGNSEVSLHPVYDTRAA